MKNVERLLKCKEKQNWIFLFKKKEKSAGENVLY